LRTFTPPSAARRPTLAALGWLCVSTGIIASSLPPVLPAVMRDLGMTPPVAGVALGTWQAALALCSVPLGVLLPRIGPRRAVLAGALLAAGSAVLRALAPNPAVLIAAVALGGVAWPLVVGTAAALLSGYEGAGRRLAAGVMFSSINAGFALMLAIGPLLERLPGGWRTALLLAAAPMLAGILPWLLVSRRLRFGRAVAAVPLRTVAGQAVSLLATIAVAAPLLVAITGLSIGHGLSSWLPTLLRQEGASPSLAGDIAAAFMTLGIFSSLGVSLAVRPAHRRWWLCGVLVAVAGALLLLETGSIAGTAVALVVVGCAIGMFPPLVLLALYESSAAREQGAATGGLYYATMGFAGLLGPALLGVFAGLTGAFAAGLNALAVIAVVGAVVAARLPESGARSSANPAAPAIYPEEAVI
jgi:MFS family permease